MYSQIQPVSTQPKDNIDAVIERGMQWMDKSVHSAATKMLPPMSDDKQAMIWQSVKDDPNALQSYVMNLGSKQGITDPKGLDNLAREYISTQRVKYGE